MKGDGQRVTESNLKCYLTAAVDDANFQIDKPKANREIASEFKSKTEQWEELEIGFGLSHHKKTKTNPNHILNDPKKIKESPRVSFGSINPTTVVLIGIKYYAWWY